MLPLCPSRRHLAMQRPASGASLGTAGAFALLAPEGSEEEEEAEQPASPPAAPAPAPDAAREAIEKHELEEEEEEQTQLLQEPEAWPALGASGAPAEQRRWGGGVRTGLLADTGAGNGAPAGPANGGLQLDLPLDPSSANGLAGVDVLGLDLGEPAWHANLAAAPSAACVAAAGPDVATRWAVPVAISAAPGEHTAASHELWGQQPAAPAPDAPVWGASQAGGESAAAGLGGRQGPLGLLLPSPAASGAMYVASPAAAPLLSATSDAALAASVGVALRQQQEQLQRHWQAGKETWESQLAPQVVGQQQGWQPYQQDTKLPPPPQPLALGQAEQQCAWEAQLRAAPAPQWQAQLRAAPGPQWQAQTAEPPATLWKAQQEPQAAAVPPMQWQHQHYPHEQGGGNGGDDAEMQELLGMLGIC